MTTSQPLLKLNDGSSIPVIGFGIGTTHFAKEVSQHVLSALKTGYVYLDGAHMYKNSGSIREALKQFGAKREDVYVLEKVGIDGGPDNNPRTVLLNLLKELDLDYVDMYLIHTPLICKPLTLAESWKIMEELKKEGLAHSIGVSNYREEDLVELKKTWEIPPAVNQIEFHPYVAHAANMQRLIKFLDENNIKIQAYGPSSPLVRFPGGPLDPVINDVASANGSEPGQVLLQWAAQYGQGNVVTTSKNSDRQKQQLEAITTLKPLSQQQVDAITQAGEKQFSRNFMKPIWDAAKP